MSDQGAYDRLLGAEAPWWCRPVRGGLAAAAMVYRAGITLRNARFDRQRGVHRVNVPVISVGNLTIGGTGKTPFVVAMVQRLVAMGRSPAVVARGYKSDAGGANDEERLIRSRCPETPYVADPDRVAAAERACRRFGADVIVLDDGFQHRRLARTLDIVLVDATCPFGHGHLLPRGLLREPVESLGRADVIVMTRCDQVSTTTREGIRRRLQSLAGRALHMQCVHRVSEIERLDGTPHTETLEGRRVVLFSGVARPSAFLTTVRSLGAEVVGHRWWPDHHRYRTSDVDSLVRTGRFPSHDFLLTTEKDAVKLAELPGIDSARIHVLKVAIDFLDNGRTMLHDVLEKVLAESQPR